MNLDTKIDFLIPKLDNGAVDSMAPDMQTVLSGIWAKKIRLIGSEAIKLGLDYNTVRVNFIVRHREDINEDMFILHRNSIYNIIGFEKSKDDENYMIIASVKKAGGNIVNEAKA